MTARESLRLLLADRDFQDTAILVAFVWAVIGFDALNWI